MPGTGCVAWRRAPTSGPQAREPHRTGVEIARRRVIFTPVGKIPGVEGQQVTLQTFAHGTSLVAVGVANRAAVSALIPAGNLASACRWAGASACWAAASPAKA